MSSTRRSTDGRFHQERFCSSPEFEGDAINGLAAAKRIAIVKSRSVREVLWWIQWRSIAPAGLQRLCDELLSQFRERVGTPTLRKILARKKKCPTSFELKSIRSECCRVVKEADIRDFLDFPTSDAWRSADREEICLSPEQEVESRMADCRHEANTSLRQHLMSCCLDPAADLSTSPWYFDDLLGALTILRNREIEAALSRLADTIVTRKINETLDFCFARRRMILIEGVAGIGRTATTRTWCDAHAGLARYVEVASSSDDRSFFASIARELGVARGSSYKSQEIKVRVEEMLSTSELMLVFDEAQYLFGQFIKPRKTPDRLLWVKSTLDAGTPIALVAHTDFSKWQAHFVAKTLWTDEQFVRRLNRHVTLPTEHSRDDMLKIARAQFPSGDTRNWKLLASYALGTEKKQASGIVEALESARYRAEQDNRSEVKFEDIEAALTYDHYFLNSVATEELQTARKPVAKRVKPSGKRSEKVVSVTHRSTFAYRKAAVFKNEAP
jgi:hypothetical protein